MLPTEVGMWESSSAWVELFCHPIPSGSSWDVMVEPRLLIVGVLVLTDSGTVGVDSGVGLDVDAGMGLKWSCSDVVGFFPLGTVSLLGFRTLRLNGHCWRPHRARLLGFRVLSQGSLRFLAHVTLRIRTPPPQETEHSLQLPTVQSDGHRMSLLQETSVFGFSRCWQSVAGRACSSEPMVWMHSTVLFFSPYGPHVVEHASHSPAHHLQADTEV